MRCLECGNEVHLRRNIKGRFYYYCGHGLGHEHRYDPGLANPEDVPGFVRSLTEAPPSNVRESKEASTYVRTEKPADQHAQKTEGNEDGPVQQENTGNSDFNPFAW